MSSLGLIGLNFLHEKAVLQNLLDGKPLVWVPLQHPEQQLPSILMNEHKLGVVLVNLAFLVLLDHFLHFLGIE